MSKLYYLKQKYNIVLVFSGDHNQIPPVQDDQFKLYHTTRFFNKLCGNNKLTLSYKEEFARYDIQTKKYLDYLLENK